MPGADETYNSLLDFGIDTVIAREASKRYLGNVEAAADWCFGAGANWAPAPMLDLPKYGEHKVEHHEVVDHGGSTGGLYVPAPPLPPRRSQVINVGSNNPFYGAGPPPPREIINVDDDEDADLQRAIRLSKETDLGDSAMGEDREQRERSIRATAPPPSPDREKQKELNELDEESEVMGSLFGPSTKEEAGASAMITLRGADDKPSKEDEDLNRAIQDSLMTASFHSASAAQHVTRPKPEQRKEGAPLVFLSESGEAAYGAHFLQALYAVPQVRAAILHFVEDDQAEDSTPSTTTSQSSLEKLFQAGSSSKDSFVEVDEVIRLFVPIRPGSQLPPRDSQIPLLMELGKELVRAMQTKVEKFPALKEESPIWARPELLTCSIVYPQLGDLPNYVTLERSAGIPHSIYPHLADVLWRPDAAAKAMEEIAEVLTVSLIWTFGAERTVWELEERIVLDRFMKENLAWATQIRAQEAVAKGNHRRLKERLDHLTQYQGNNFQDSLSAVIKHYEATSTDNDENSLELQTELKAKLESTLEALQAKSTALQADLKREEEIIGGALFQTDQPEYNQHVYTLRAVLMHDGATIPGKHLYAYVRADNGAWWKIEEHEATEVQFEAMKKDQTGLWMGGGPYALIYARDGPRPVRQRSDPPASAEMDTVMTEGGDAEGAGSATPLQDNTTTTSASLEAPPPPPQEAAPTPVLTSSTSDQPPQDATSSQPRSDEKSTMPPSPFWTDMKM